MNIKSPFVRYFVWVYMNTASTIIESGASDVPHDPYEGNFIVQIFYFIFGLLPIEVLISTLKVVLLNTKENIFTYLGKLGNISEL